MSEYRPESRGDNPSFDSLDATQRFVEQVGTRVYLSSNQTISPDTETQISLDSVTFDDRGEFKPSTNTIDIQYNGLYLLQGSIQFRLINDQEQTQVKLAVNGSLVKTALSSTSGDGKYPGFSAQSINRLSAGDSISLRGQHDASGSKDVTGAESATNLTVIQIA